MGVGNKSARETINGGDVRVKLEDVGKAAVAVDPRLANMLPTSGACRGPARHRRRHHHLRHSLQISRVRSGIARPQLSRGS